VIGVGAYEGCNTDNDLQDEVLSIVAAGASTVLLHRCPNLARRVAERFPQTRRILRGDPGDDGAQYRRDVTPEAAAETFYWRFVADAWATGWYTAVHGPNELLANSDPEGIRFRLLMEAHLARLVHARCRCADGSVAEYVALACPVGNVDAGHFAMFENETRALVGVADIFNYHGYIREMATSIGRESDGAYLWRPVDEWAPMLRRLGMRVPPILLGECGTYFDPARSGISQEQEARLVCEIGVAYAAKCRAHGLEFIAALPFGLGTVGSMSQWDQRGQGGIYRTALAAAAPDAPDSQGGQEMTLEQLAAKVIHLERQNAHLTAALKALREDRWTGADGVDGHLVAMTGKDDFQRAFPKA
jgi:hypothetical protein